IDVSPDVTRAATVVAAINGTGAFTATLDDKLDALNDGNGLLDVTATAVTSGGAGEDFDAAAGLRIENAGEVHTFNFAGAETIEDLLNILNAPDAGLYAAINSAGNGLDVRTRISGANFAVGENGGRTATQLGLRTLLESTYLAELNFGQGVQPYEGIDFTVWRRDGVTLDIDLSAATTLGDVLDLINNHPANVGNAVTARLAEFGNGIELVDPLAAGSGDLAVLKRGGTAAWQLGLIPHGEDQSVAQAPAAGQPQRLTGRDVHPREAVGIFTSLLRLAEALEADSLPDIQRAAALLDDAFTDLTFVRAGLGGKASNLETLDERIDQEEIQLRTTLSSEIDADLVKSVSDLTARQASLEASLRLVAEAFRLSVLDFL
ncbi:MAG: flagellin, partial [Pirellulaceae bacterium]